MRDGGGTRQYQEMSRNFGDGTFFSTRAQQTNSINFGISPWGKGLQDLTRMGQMPTESARKSPTMCLLASKFGQAISYENYWHLIKT